MLCRTITPQDFLSGNAFREEAFAAKKRNRPKRSQTRVTRAANAVLNKWGNGNMSEVIQELDAALRAAGSRQC